MFKRRFMFYIVVVAVLFSGYLGYRFYEHRVKPTPAAKAMQFEANETDRVFLERAEPVSQLPRDLVKQSPLLITPVWTYTPQKWDSGAVDSVNAIALATDAVGFEATKLPDGKAYRLPAPEEKTLLAGDVISAEEVIYRIFTTPENAPEIPFDEPIFRHDVPLSEDPPIPYPLIAKFLNKQDDTSLTALTDWIKSVGGAARAQSLIEAAGLSDSIRIETVTILRR